MLGLTEHDSHFSGYLLVAKRASPRAEPVLTFVKCFLLFHPNSINRIKLVGLVQRASRRGRTRARTLYVNYRYLLATCTFTPLYGRLCNVMGRRGANQTAVLFAAIGTIACGLSGNMETLIAARFLGGLGGGGIMTTATVITSDMYSLRQRGLTQGIASIFNSVSSTHRLTRRDQVSQMCRWVWV